MSTNNKIDTIRKLKKSLIALGFACAFYSGIQKKDAKPEEVTITIENTSEFDYLMSNIKNKESEVIVNPTFQEIEEERVEETTAAPVETEPETEPEPTIEYYEEHIVPTVEQITEFIRNKYGLAQRDFDRFVSECVLASEEYSIPYTEEQVIKVWYLIAAMPREKKLKYIEERWGMTEEEIVACEAITISESKQYKDETTGFVTVGDYVDSFGVTDTNIARTKDPGYSKYGGDAFDQYFVRGQFEVVTRDLYQNKLGTPNNGFLDAMVAYGYTKDLGLTPLRVRTCIEFRSCSTYVEGNNYIQLVPNGNKYLLRTYIPASKYVDGYEPYNELTDDYFHQILCDRGLCYIVKKERVLTK